VDPDALVARTRGEKRPCGMPGDRPATVRMACQCGQSLLRGETPDRQRHVRTEQFGHLLELGRHLRSGERGPRLVWQCWKSIAPRTFTNILLTFHASVQRRQLRWIVCLSICPSIRLSIHPSICHDFCRRGQASGVRLWKCRSQCSHCIVVGQSLFQTAKGDFDR
jgi:hypothetical protein